MSKTVPPSMFFGKRTTRGQTKGLTDCATTSVKSSVCKTSGHEEELHQACKSERNLRSTVKRCSKLICGNIMTPEPSLVSTIQSCRPCKNSRSRSPQHKHSKTCIKKSKTEMHSTKADTGKNVVTQNVKNPVYKQAKCKMSLVQSTVEDEYEFQAETPQGEKKKLKKRQPRQKNTMQSLWGLKFRPETKRKLKSSSKVFIQEHENVTVDKMIQPASVSKDLLSAAKKTVAPLQEITGNTLCSIVTSNIDDKCSDKLISNLGGKKNSDESASQIVNKCVLLNYDYSDKNMKENTPVVVDKVSDSSGTKCFPTPLKENLSTSHSNSTPRLSLQSPAINNMSVVLSPIHKDCHTSSSRQNSMHASTPLKSNIGNKTPVNNISCKKMYCGNVSQSKIQTSISNHEIQPFTYPFTGKDKRPTQSQNNQHHSLDPSPELVDQGSISVLGSEVVNDTDRLPLPSMSEHLQCGRPQFKEEVHNSKKRFPVPQSCSTWRLGSSAKYNFDLKLTLENCFGFDDDDIDTNHKDVVQSNHSVIPEVTSSLNGKKTCGLLKKKTYDQFQEKNVHQSQIGNSPLPEKQVTPRQMGSQLQTKRNLKRANTFELKKHLESSKRQTTLKPVVMREKHVNDELPVRASPPQDTAGLLSPSLMKLREKKNNADHTIYSNIPSLEHCEPMLSSQLTLPTSSFQHTSKDDENTRCKTLPTLFDDIMEESIYKSPFSEPPRRSYACRRPMKRLALEEEGEGEEENEEPGKERQRPGPAKRNKTVYKRKKVVKTTSEDQWAKVLSSHFAEVDDVDLITE